MVLQRKQYLHNVLFTGSIQLTWARKEIETENFTTDYPHSFCKTSIYIQTFAIQKHLCGRFFSLSSLFAQSVPSELYIWL